MSNLSAWARKAVGLPEINLIKTPAGNLVASKLTPPVIQKLVKELPRQQLDTLYAEAHEEIIRRRRAEEGQVAL